MSLSDRVNYLCHSHFHQYHLCFLIPTPKSVQIESIFQSLATVILCIVCIILLGRNRSINHTGSQNYNFEQAKWKLNETNETQSAASITKFKKWNAQYTGNQNNVPTITGHVFVEESRKSNTGADPENSERGGRVPSLPPSSPPPHHR